MSATLCHEVRLYVNLWTCINRAMAGGRDESARIRAARPLCIQHATGQAQVEHSLFVTGKYTLQYLYFCRIIYLIVICK